MLFELQFGMCMEKRMHFAKTIVGMRFIHFLLLLNHRPLCKNGVIDGLNELL